MATTTPDNIQYPVNSDQVAPLASHFQNLAESTQTALDTKTDNDDARLSDERVPTDNSVTSAKIVNGAIVNDDINASAAIDKTKIAGTAITATDSGTVTSTIIAQNTITTYNIQNGTILDDDVSASAAIAFSKLALPAADVNVNTHKVVNVVDPTSDQDAATKAYVDSTVAGGTTSGSRTVYVKAGMALTKGQPVYISGANGTNVIVSAAGNDSEATSSKTIGLINSTVANNGFAYVTTNGLLSGLDTSGAGAEGDAVWLGPSGTLLYGLTNKPYAPAHLVYIGVVAKKNGSTGEILINPQNGFELDELHDVDFHTVAPSAGDVVVRNAANTLWENKPQSALPFVSQTDGTVTTASTSSTVVRNITLSTSDPSGGSDGDVWLKYTP